MSTRRHRQRPCAPAPHHVIDLTLSSVPRRAVVELTPEQETRLAAGESITLDVDPTKYDSITVVASQWVRTVGPIGAASEEPSA